MPKQKGNKNPLGDYSIYLSAVFQMALIILAFVLLGRFLDGALGLGFPVFTLILSLLGVGLGLYRFIKSTAPPK
jgi:F0F1-type ATP synthase assembly protein I